MPVKVRLQLNNLKLYGRETEVDLLLNAYHKTKGDGSRAQVFFVRGESGCGKTAVVEEVQKFVLQEQNEHLSSIDKEEVEKEEQPPEEGKDEKEEEARPCSSSQSSFFVSGKFDLQQNNAQTFSALAGALTDLIEQVMKPNQSSVSYRQKILDSLGDEWRTLTQAIPKLNDLMMAEQQQKNDNDPKGTKASSTSAEKYTSAMSNQTGANHGLIKLKALFQTLMSALSSPQHPVVMFLDDLQFGDEASLDLIESLFIDPDLHNLLFVCTYRSDEVSPSLQKLVDSLASKDHCKDYTTSVEVKAMTIESLNQMLSDLLKLRSEDTQPLAQIIDRKVHGNIFFVLQFLQTAQYRGLLVFDTLNGKWTWDGDRIFNEMKVGTNVVHLLVERLHEFPPQVQVLLNIASYIGAQFDSRVLATLYKNRNEQTERLGGFMGMESIPLADKTEEEQTKDMLKTVQSQELIAVGDKGQYLFCHDRIQQACNMLGAEEEGGQSQQQQKITGLRVGVQLLRLFYSPLSQRWMLFAAVTCLNRSSDVISPEERFELARLNLETGKRAQKESAFLLAAEYLRKGIDLLDDNDKWTHHYKLTVEMYTMSVEMEYTGGRLKRAEEMASELMSTNLLSEEDARPLYYTLMRASADQTNHTLALDIGVKSVKGLGVTLPRHPNTIQLLWDIYKTTKLLKGRTDMDLLSLPKMTNPTKIEAMAFLRFGPYSAWATASGELLMVVAMKMLRMTVRYGNNPNTGAAYGLFALLCSSMGWRDEAFRFAKLAERWLEQDEKETGAAMSKSIVQALIQPNACHWRRPLVDSLDPLLEAHRAGMIQSGDVGWACLCISVYASIYVHTGLPLGPFASDMRKLCQLMRNYGQEFQITYTVVGFQLALNLMGESTNPTTLTGEAMDQEDMLGVAERSGAPTLSYFVIVHQMMLAYYMGDTKLAKECVVNMRAIGDVFKGHAAWPNALMFMALTEFAVAREKGATTKNPPKQAMTTYNFIHSLEKEGGVNQHVMRLLLEAEANTFGKKRDDVDSVRKGFDDAISAATRTGTTHLAAIANERAADYMLSSATANNSNDKNDAEYWAGVYLRAARDCYARWDATVKVEQLEQRHRQLLSRSTRPSTAEGRLRGTERIETLDEYDSRSIADIFQE